jgi:hypothetical protein
LKKYEVKGLTNQQNEDMEDSLVDYLDIAETTRTYTSRTEEYDYDNGNTRARRIEFWKLKKISDTGASLIFS